jgi:hypothetical protein
MADETEPLNEFYDRYRDYLDGRERRAAIAAGRTRYRLLDLFRTVDVVQAPGGGLPTSSDDTPEVWAQQRAVAEALGDGPLTTPSE